MTPPTIYQKTIKKENVYIDITIDIFTGDKLDCQDISRFYLVIYYGNNDNKDFNEVLKISTTNPLGYERMLMTAKLITSYFNPNHIDTDTCLQLIISLEEGYCKLAKQSIGKSFTDVLSSMAKDIKQGLAGIIK